MTKFTKEQLIEEAKQAVEGCRRLLRVSPGVEAHKISLRLAEVTLAALTAPEQEPVAYMYRDGDDIEYNGHNEFSDGGRGVPLYAAPPAPISVPTFEEWCERNEQKPLGWVRDAMKEAYEGCRAAMLQGNHRDLSYPVDPQIAAYEKIMEQAIPDGYALVPVEPTAEMIEATFAGEMELQSVQHQIRNRERRAHYYRAMLASVPDFREIPDSSTIKCRESAETSTNCPKCGGRGSYHCPQMLGTVECECTLPAAPQQEVK